ncbi:hydrogen peroxide-dependent heme synthase [Glutamicibacter creatinolyticus]|uniref:Coproheme decarboxylase n=2 Tax=Glutamicibacter creatinolyticus TaxID=162496 RepID=A0A5B7WX22_9MICC|nr:MULTISPECIES: hydrogen peroxide-dependent heme synthase [Glutamicibacter]QCY47633.1 Chlorite dismutase family protein [Glutamicibacter creatinolyticus]TLK51172.1 chlorite dismutase [Glutamicibacter sp. V16R2B1]
MTERPENNSPVLRDREAAGNATMYYTLWTVFKRSVPAERGQGAAEFETLVQELADQGVSVRGLYDVSAMRQDADVMVWIHGPAAELLQAGMRRIRRSALFAGTEIAYSTMAVHREAEFAKDHSPAFARGLDAKEWMTVYPFVRSHDWYTLDPASRGKMLRDHGILGRDFPNVLANTVAAFSFSDYEWQVCLEADDMIDLVDMMRHLRYTEARHHVREETPFYTGRRISAAEVAEVLQ